MRSLFGDLVAEPVPRESPVLQRAQGAATRFTSGPTKNPSNPPWTLPPAGRAHGRPVGRQPDCRPGEEVNVRVACRIMFRADLAIGASTGIAVLPDAL